MRYYIRKQTMRMMLDDIVKKKDLQTLDIFREVMVYRCTSEKKTEKTRSICKNVAGMLMIPRIILLSMINVIAASFCLALLPDIFTLRIHPELVSLLSLGLSIFILCEFYRAYRASRRLPESFPYVVIDELIKRKIIKLVPKKQSDLSTKNNPKAKVAE